MIWGTLLPLLMRRHIWENVSAHAALPPPPPGGESKGGIKSDGVFIGTITNTAQKHSGINLREDINGSNHGTYLSSKCKRSKGVASGESYFSSASREHLSIHAHGLQPRTGSLRDE